MLNKLKKRIWSLFGEEFAHYKVQENKYSLFVSVFILWIGMTGCQATWKGYHLPEGYFKSDPKSLQQIYYEFSYLNCFCIVRR